MDLATCARELFNQGQHQSCVQLCSLLLLEARSAADTGAAAAETTAGCHELLGDCLLALRQHRRARASFSDAADVLRSAGAAGTPAAYRVAEKAAEACVKIGDDGTDAEAAKLLCGVPSDARSLSATILLASIKRRRGSAKAASDLYYAALQKNPFCLDAVSAYLDTLRVACLQQQQPGAAAAGGAGNASAAGAASTPAAGIALFHAKAAELLRLYQSMEAAAANALPATPQHVSAAAAAAGDDSDDDDFFESGGGGGGGGRGGRAVVPGMSRVSKWVEMQVKRVAADYEGVRDAAAVLCGGSVLGAARGGGSPSVVVASEVAQAYYRSGKPAEAGALFEAIRSHDPFATHGMDVFSIILKQAGNLDMLRVLADTLVECAPEAVESWIVASVLRSATTPLDDHAIQYALKGVTLSGGTSSRACSYIASLWLSSGYSDNAVYYYLKALSLSKEVPTYQGIVKAYIKAKEARPALAMAKEAAVVFPSCASTWALVGWVYHNAQRHDQARDYYNRAMRIDPHCVEALMYLSELECEGRNFAAAIARLKGAVPSDTLLQQLGHIYISVRQLGDARKAFVDALQLNPHNARAAEGLKRLADLETREE
eukprot:Rhum_TRINITY_DN10774_c0_g1::Rhum_TRINITY_DN10774_c0_g1_i1::g.40143::m.40143/K03354/APC7; anaphase-promoting complex subunit 7